MRGVSRASNTVLLLVGASCCRASTAAHSVPALARVSASASLHLTSVTLCCRSLHLLQQRQRQQRPLSLRQSFHGTAPSSFAPSQKAHEHRVRARRDPHRSETLPASPPSPSAARHEAAVQRNDRLAARSSPPPGPYAPLEQQHPDGANDTSAAPTMASESSSQQADVLLHRLTHALVRINRTVPRSIASPPTQPRRASVAILIRVRPHEDDDEWLSEQYDADGQPLPGSEAERIMSQPVQDPIGADQSAASGSTSMSNSGSVSDTFTQQQRRLPPHASHTSASSGDASLLGASGISGMTSSGIDVSSGSASGAESAVDLGGLSMGGSTEGKGDVGRPDVDPVSSASASGRSSSATSSSPSSGDGTHETLQRFFSLPWVQRGQPEVLYIKRASRETDKWSAHVAFPGGRKEDGDENGLYTAMRETWEEIGLDLAEKEFVNVGKLDDREITTSLGKRLLMVLSPYSEKGACCAEAIGRKI